MPLSTATTQVQAPLVNPYTAGQSPAPLAMVLLIAAVACFCAGILLARRQSIRALFVRTAPHVEVREPVRQSVHRSA